MSIEIKKSIQEAIQQFKSGNITENAIALFNCLGYNTDRQSPLLKPTFDAFRDSFIADHCRFHEEKALAKSWKYVDLLFQLSKDEITRQNSLFDTKQVDRTIIETYLFFAIDLHPGNYSRTALSQITREVNKLFPMPVMVLFKVESSLTLSIINRRLHKRDESRDVLEKVTLIKDISIENPHRAHIEILFDLSFPELLRIHNFTNFVELHNAWQKTLDIKELNRKFYREIADWYFWATKEVEFPEDLEKNRDIRNATSTIRLLTRIIFVWFIKEKSAIPNALFSKAELKKILKEFDHPETSDKTIYYKAILQNLFFATLSTEQKDRKFREKGWKNGRNPDFGNQYVYRYENMVSDIENWQSLFFNIPFLNGGLFENLDNKESRIMVDGFSEERRNSLSVPDYLFFSVEKNIDLNDTYDTKGKTYWVKGLLSILDQYKFTVAENTPIEEEVALDPELLGKVFENLLACFNPETKTTARKQTGSFYTPREIVDYMVDESLKHALATRASALLSNTTAVDMQAGFDILFAYTEKEHAFNPKEVEAIVKAVAGIKILDPACGSGAFPMGILHKLTYILNKLDPDNTVWRELQKENAIQETKAAYDLGQKEDRHTRIKEIEEAFDFNTSDYGRKLFLIENAIYGVDIQPIAVQIAKLRFFISLIVDQDLNQKVKPLPNLETKFVAADSLIGKKKHDESSSTSLADDLFDNPEIETLEKELKLLRHRHFNARNSEEKETIRKRDKILREKIASLVEKSDGNEKRAKQLVSWDPYDQNHYASFFDCEWMYGNTGGFDVVLGNPPYVQIQNFSGQDIQKAWQEQNYLTFAKTGDIYCLFYERGYQLLRQGGTLAYITSNKWMRANYGKVMRRFFNTNGSILRLIDFGDSPIFENATTYTNILVWKKDEEAGKEKTQAWDLSKAYASDTTLEEMLEKQGQCDALFNEDSYVVVKGEQTKIKRRIEEVGTPLKDWDIAINYGIKTGLNEAFIIDGKKKDELIAQDPKSAEILKPILRGRDIKRYKAEFAENWVIVAAYGSYSFLPKKYSVIVDYLTGFRDKLQARGQCQYNSSGKPNLHGDFPGQHHWLELDNNPKKEYLHLFEDDKIVWLEMSPSSNFTLDQNKKYVLNTAYILTGEHLRYLLALLNSKVLDYYFPMISTDVRGQTRRYTKQYVEKCPIPRIPPSSQLPFTILVDCILFCKSHSLDSESSLLESVIDGLVFDLYFPVEMKAAHCYITDRISSVLKPFKKSDSVAFKKEYISELCRFFNKDETVYHGLIHRRTVKEVQIVTGEKT